MLPCVVSSAATVTSATSEVQGQSLLAAMGYYNREFFFLLFKPWGCQVGLAPGIPASGRPRKDGGGDKHLSCYLSPVRTGDRST